MTTERKYRRFTPEFKREAVRQMSDSNKHCTQLARELGIRVNQLYKWKSELETKSDDAFPGAGRPAGPEGELAKLKRENERLKQLSSPTAIARGNGVHLESNWGQSKVYLT